MRRILLLAAFLSVLSTSSLGQELTRTTVTTGPSELKVGGAVTTPFTITMDDLKKMPRKTLRIENTRFKKTDVYEGVPLEVLLQKAGVPAADNYQVVFSLAELDSGFLDSEVLLADTMDGAPLAPDQGPLKLVAPHEKRPARWVKMVKSITVGRVAN